MLHETVPDARIDPPEPKIVRPSIDIDHRDEDKRPTNFETEAVNYLNILRMRLPEGVKAHLTAELLLSDRWNALETRSYVFGAWIGDKYICRACSNRSQRMERIDDLVEMVEREVKLQAMDKSASESRDDDQHEPERYDGGLI